MDNQVFVDRVPIMITPEARKVLLDLLFMDEMIGIGYSDFILKAARDKMRIIQDQRKFFLNLENKK